MRASVSIPFTPAKHPLANSAHAFHVFRNPDTSADCEAVHGISTGIPIDLEALVRGKTFISIPVGFNLIFIDGLIKSMAKRRVNFLVAVEDGPDFILEYHVAGGGLV
jgi:hypothetical protein